MIVKRYRDERGPTDAGWLKSMHTFSFGHYMDPNHMGFGPLRVINEDRVIGGSGFGAHPHSNMEIVSYVLDGALEHKDSMGNGSIIKPGDIQRMSAGSGVTHSEYNHSQEDNVHFLQIWFLPEKDNIEPSYEQKSFEDADKKGAFKLVMARGGTDGAVDINQDINMYVSLLDEDDNPVTFTPEKGRVQWIQLARGMVTVNGETLKEGDGLAVKDEDALVFSDALSAEILLFDMKG